MSSYRRNVMVGLTVIGAIIALTWMILQFGGNVAEPFAKPSVKVIFTTSRADGVAEGSQVYYRGVISGKVTQVERLPSNTQVRITAEVEINPPLPGNVVAVIRLTNFLGGSTGITLEIENDAAPTGVLKDGQEVPTRYVGLDVLPTELTNLAGELGKTSAQFRESNVIGNLNTQISKIGTLVDSLQQVVGNEKMHSDLTDAIADFRTAAANAKQVTEDAQKVVQSLPKVTDNANGAITDARTTIADAQKHLDDISHGVNDRLAQAGTTLDSVNSVVAKIDKGDGTLGKLVNDPKLYQNLLETTDQLHVGSSDLARLLEQWEQEGVSLKLK